MQIFWDFPSALAQLTLRHAGPDAQFITSLYNLLKSIVLRLADSNSGTWVTGKKCLSELERFLLTIMVTAQVMYFIYLPVTDLQES